MATKGYFLAFFLCLTVIHANEDSTRTRYGYSESTRREGSDRKSNPISHSFQPIHRQQIQRSRVPIQRHTVRLDTIITDPIQRQVVREDTVVKSSVLTPRKDAAVHVSREPPKYLQQEVRRQRSGSYDSSDRELDNRPDVDVSSLERSQEQDRESYPSRDRQTDLGLEEALIREPTTVKDMMPDLLLTTVSPTLPAYTTVNTDKGGQTVPGSTTPNKPDDDDDDDEEDDEDDDDDGTASNTVQTGVVDETEIENGINSRRRDQSPIQTAIDYTKYKPRKRNLREKKLLRLLGEDYDPDWMSFERPTELRNLQPVGIAYKTDANLLKALNNLNFTFQSPNGLSFQPPPQLLNVFKDWLIRKAGCPVLFTWHDIGDYYWPRWVKRGECVNDSPCSWPPGQRCVPVRSHTVFILRWHCRRTLPRYLRRGRRFQVYRSSMGGRDVPRRRSRDDRREERRTRDDRRRSRSGRRDLHPSSLQSESRPASGVLTSRIKCRWLKIPYPVIANCFCTCP